MYEMTVKIFFGVFLTFIIFGFETLSVRDSAPQQTEVPRHQAATLAKVVVKSR